MTEHEELIKAQSGDHNAFNSLLKPYISSAYQVAFMLLRERAGADDAVQEALIKSRLHNARGKLKNQLLSSPQGDISLKEGWTWNKN